METAARLVFCTLPDGDTARQIGTVLVQRQLAACVNLIPGVTSIYRWKDAVKQDREVLAVIKVSAAGFPALQAALAELHPYEVPEIIAVDIDAGLPAYLRWLVEACAD